MNPNYYISKNVYKGKIGTIYPEFNNYRQSCSCGRIHDYPNVFDTMIKVRDKVIVKPSIFDFKRIVLKGTDNMTDMPCLRKIKYDYDFVYKIDEIRQYLLDKYDDYIISSILENHSMSDIFLYLQSKFDVKDIILLLDKEFDIYKIDELLDIEYDYDSMYHITDICMVMNIHNYTCMKCRNDILQFYRGIHVPSIEILPMKPIER